MVNPTPPLPPPSSPPTPVPAPCKRPRTEGAGAGGGAEAKPIPQTEVASASAAGDACAFDVSALLEELECSICSKLLYEPVTLPCGHAFCRRCLARALDARDSCALCRAVVHVDTSRPLPVSHALHAALARAAPALYAARRRETEEDECGGLAGGTSGGGRLPLFPLNHCVFPGQRFPLHIFEPRYRLMLRRVLAGSRRFGLLLGPADVGCVLEVTHSVPMPDGRSLIETVARERFAVRAREEIDGYMVGRVDLLVDRPVEAHDEGRASALCSRARTAMDTLLSCPALADARSKVAEAPPPEQGSSALSLWLAGLLVTDTHERQQLLECTDALFRLDAMCQLLEQYCEKLGRQADRDRDRSTSTGAGGTATAPQHRECVIM